MRLHSGFGQCSPSVHIIETAWEKTPIEWNNGKQRLGSRLKWDICKYWSEPAWMCLQQVWGRSRQWSAIIYLIKMLEVFLFRQRLFSCMPFWWDYYLLLCSRVLIPLLLLFLGIWVTGPSSTPWSMGLMNGSGPQTAILDLLITERSPISLCIGTGKWLAGNSATCLVMLFSLLSLLTLQCWKISASIANPFQWKGVGKTSSCFRIRVTDSGGWAVIYKCITLCRGLL